VSRLPRLLPLVAVAVGGVLVINLMAGASSAPQLFQGARAWAEDLAPKAKSKAKAAPAAAAAVTPAAVEPKADSPLPPAAASGPMGLTPVSTVGACAPTQADLANRAGLSPAELQVLQSLGARRTALDAREQTVSSQMQLLSAAEQKIDGKLASMQDLIKQMQALLGQADQQEQAENARLVKTYETMDKKAAAHALAIMTDDVRLPIMAHMKEAKLAERLKEMTPAQAAEITQKLANRTREAFALDQARAAVAAASGAPAQTAAAPARAGAATSAPATATPAPARAGAAAPARSAAAPATTPAAPARSASAAPTPAAAPARAGAPAGTAPSPASKTG